MINKKILIAITLLCSLSVSYADEIQPIGISKLIDSFMINSGDTSNWSIGSDVEKIQWQPISQMHDGRSKKVGTARVSIEGKEIRNPGKNSKPVYWEIFMSGEKNSVPESVGITPQCDNVECTFEVLHPLRKTGHDVKKLCSSEIQYAEITGYKITKDGKSIFMRYELQGGGSGGSSNTLTLYWKAAESPEALCAEML